MIEFLVLLVIACALAVVLASGGLGAFETCGIVVVALVLIALLLAFQEPLEALLARLPGL